MLRPHPSQVPLGNRPRCSYIGPPGHVHPGFRLGSHLLKTPDNATGANWATLRVGFSPTGHMVLRAALQRPKYFLRPHSAGSVAAGLGRPVSPVSATARRFAANPSDPTSRWAPCPAQASSETAALSLLSVSRHSCAQRGVTPAFGYGPRLGRSGWTLTSKDHAPPGAHYRRVRLPRRCPAPSGALPFGKPYSALAKTVGDLPGSRSLVLPPCRAHTPRRGLRRPRPWRPRTLAFQA